MRKHFCSHLHSSLISMVGILPLSLTHTFTHSQYLCFSITLSPFYLLFLISFSSTQLSISLSFCLSLSYLTFLSCYLPFLFLSLSLLLKSKTNLRILHHVDLKIELIEKFFFCNFLNWIIFDNFPVLFQTPITRRKTNVAASTPRNDENNGTTWISTQKLVTS